MNEGENKARTLSIAALAAKTKLNEKFVELLYSRSIDSVEKIERFLNPSFDYFNNPFDLEDMDKAVERLSRAIKQGEVVLIYGDYDVDGICSSAILYDFLKKAGADARVHIPHRFTDGYGINLKTIDSILDAHKPSLVLTCDCGVSCATEIEYILGKEIDVIVTDHHEAPQQLPRCACINPKRENQKYAFGGLCGAGVAFKLAQAVQGREKALQYLALAALATVADIVPLVDENRLIVQLGLIELNKHQNLGLKTLCERLNLKLPLTASEISYYLAPRLNAVGRMGDPVRAFELLISQDIEKINQIIDEIERNNDERKRTSEQIYRKVTGITDPVFWNKNCLMICDSSFSKGVIGIVASRLAAEFTRPVFLAAHDNEVLSGTARSVDGLDIHKGLSSAQNLLIKFGGHSQAAGFTLESNNWDELKMHLEGYCSQFDSSYFKQKSRYDIEIDESDINQEFIEQLSCLEPFGRDNPRPLFKLNARALNVTAMRNYPKHLNIQLNQREIIAFNKGIFKDALLADTEKSLFVELEINEYNGIRTPRGNLKSFSCKSDYKNDDTLLAEELSQLIWLNERKKAHYSVLDFTHIFDNSRHSQFGTLFMAFKRSTYLSFLNKAKENKIDPCTDILTGANNGLRLHLGCIPPHNLALYSDVVLLDEPMCVGYIAWLNSFSKARIHSKRPVLRSLPVPKITRENFGKYYNIIRSFKNLKGESAADYCIKLANATNSCSAQMTIALAVFLELGLLSLTNSGGVGCLINDGIKSSLDNSSIYELMHGQANERINA